MVMNLYRALDRQRVQFDFLVFGDAIGAYEEEIKTLGGRIIRMPAPAQLGALRALRMMSALIRWEGPYAAVHSHINFASGLALSAARLAGVQRRVAHSHVAGGSLGVGHGSAYRTMGRTVIMLSATDIVACGDDAGAHLFGRRWEMRGQKVTNAIDVDQFLKADPAAGRQLLRDLGVSPNTRILGSVARLTYPKNHAFLLQLVVLLADATPPTVLVLAGDGELRGALELEARRLGIEDQVLFLGERRDIPRLLKAFDLLLLPSHYEGLPVVLVEAQAAGTRCLVSEAVTRETDLGLGLVEYIPLDTDRWASRIRTSSSGSLPTTEEIRNSFSQRGYAATDAAAQVLSIYGLR